MYVIGNLNDLEYLDDIKITEAQRAVHAKSKAKRHRACTFMCVREKGLTFTYARTMCLCFRLCAHRRSECIKFTFSAELCISRTLQAWIQYLSDVIFVYVSYSLTIFCALVRSMNRLMAIHN